jgi:hypothetical protein
VHFLRRRHRCKALKSAASALTLSLSLPPPHKHTQTSASSKCASALLATADHALFLYRLGDELFLSRFVAFSTLLYGGCYVAEKATVIVLPLITRSIITD